MLFLNWESKFWKRNFYQLENFQDFFPDKLMHEDVVQAKIACFDKVSLVNLQTQGFILGETEVTFQKEISASLYGARSPEVQSQPNSIQKEKLLELSSQCFNFNRFTSIFPQKEINSYYRKWMEQSINKTIDDFLFFIPGSEKVKGFVTGKITSPTHGRVGIIATSQEMRGKGLSSLLLNCLEQELAKRSCQYLEIKTHLCNPSAVKAYQKNGYKIVESHYWLYFKKK